MLGPPPTSGTRDAFVELFMEAGCRTFAWIEALKDADEARFKRVCDTVREDGAYIEAGENDNLIVQKLDGQPECRSASSATASSRRTWTSSRARVVDGVSPTFETMASGKYPASRPLFIYVKKAHIGVIPGIKEFIAEYISDKALGEEGYLADKGLIPPLKNEIGKIRDDAKALKPLKL